MPPLEGFAKFGTRRAAWHLALLDHTSKLDPEVIDEAKMYVQRLYCIRCGGRIFALSVGMVLATVDTSSHNLTCNWFAVGEGALHVGFAKPDSICKGQSRIRESPVKPFAQHTLFGGVLPLELNQLVCLSCRDTQTVSMLPLACLPAFTGVHSQSSETRKLKPISPSATNLARTVCIILHGGFKTHGIHEGLSWPITQPVKHVFRELDSR